MRTLALLVFAAWLVSEVGVAFTRRARLTGATAAGRSAPGPILLVFGLAIFLGWIVSLLDFGRIQPSAAAGAAGLACLLSGIALRRTAMARLARFFTVDLAIAWDQRVVSDGPYRFIRHPAYLGSLLAFLGYALALGSWLSVALVVVPVTVAFVTRIRAEEEVLTRALGEEYLVYRSRTKRLLPGIY